MVLATVARQAYRREVTQAALARATLGQLAGAPGLVFQIGTPLSVAVPYLQQQPSQTWAPVLHAAQPVGILRLDRLRQYPTAQWAGLLVEEVMEPLREDVVMRHSARPWMLPTASPRPMWAS